MKFSVIICTYNRAKYIDGLLKSLVNQSTNKKDFEIIFVDNNSKDNTETICNSFEAKNEDIRFSYFKETNQGLSFARNRGINESSGEILIFIDDDAIASENYLKEISSFFDKTPDASAFGGKILPMYESKRPIWMSRFIEPIMSVIDMGDNVKQFKGKRFPIGANMGFRRSAFDKTGIFNTKLGRTGKTMLGGEEKDIFNKLKNQKGKIYYLPKPWIYHIIPDERLTTSFVKKQAIGIGYSDKLRAKEIDSITLLSIYLFEIFKWGVSLLLFFYYRLSFHPKKANMIIQFRLWVSRGLFCSGVFEKL